MTILAFYPVLNGMDWDRETFEEMSHEDAFKLMWQNRYKADVRFFDMDSSWDYDAYDLGQFFCHSGDFEEIYNDEELDGGYWVKTLYVRSDYVKQVIVES